MSNSVAQTSDAVLYLFVAMRRGEHGLSAIHHRFIRL